MALGKVQRVNTVFGEYRLGEDNRIEIVDFGGTEMAGEGWGQKFREAFPWSAVYEVRSDTLILTYAEGMKAMVFLRSKQ